MQLAYIGLGKMGFNMTQRLLEKGYDVIAHNRSSDSVDKIVKEGAVGAYSVEEIFSKLDSDGSRVIWIMIPHKVVDDVLTSLEPFLKEGDVVIDGGNSFYKNSVKRAERLSAKGIVFLDVGVSGGPDGARNGASLMIGGDKNTFNNLEGLFKDLAIENGYAYLGESGAGHFVKMVHNGIEYGMMQAIAEGFDIMKNSKFNLSLREIMKPYSNGSVIRSALIKWLDDAFEKYGEDLESISGSVSHSGEGAWTIKTGKAMGIKVDVIENSLKAREYSQKNPNYQGKVVSAMRGEFGKHPVLKSEPEKNSK